MGGQTTYEGGRLNINLSLFDKLRRVAHASSILVFVQGW